MGAVLVSFSCSHYLSLKDCFPSKRGMTLFPLIPHIAFVLVAWKVRGHAEFICVLRRAFVASPRRRLPLAWEGWRRGWESPALSAMNVFTGVFVAILRHTMISHDCLQKIWHLGLTLSLSLNWRELGIMSTWVSKFHHFVFYVINPPNQEIWLPGQGWCD